eukprot:gb/GECG01005446.1/.p1 GENE.gb/GECG01005446.1/~~gb/GECG01005446.1/.p1  ORF type:complete len:130 (+),score=2.94 gb/GECG01005446.1/:1-390(+)
MFFERACGGGAESASTCSGGRLFTTWEEAERYRRACRLESHPCQRCSEAPKTICGDDSENRCLEDAEVSYTCLRGSERGRYCPPSYVARAEKTRTKKKGGALSRGMVKGTDLRASPSDGGSIRGLETIP